MLLFSFPFLSIKKLSGKAFIFGGEMCQGLTRSVKFQRKDQLVKGNAYFLLF